MVLLQILTSVIIVSLISFVGVFGLVLRRERLDRILLLLIAFAAGSLLAATFYDLIPEALKEIGNDTFNNVLVGILLFFIVEKFIHWHHCGKEECSVRPVAYLNLLGDGVHNFMDGVIIAAAYLTNMHVGIITTIAIALHEIPQEFGDFAVLLHAGLGTKKALFYNFVSATAAILGAVAGYAFLSSIVSYVPVAVAITAGGFIYIATADLMPELHAKKEFKDLLWQTVALILGVLVLYYLFGVVSE